MSITATEAGKGPFPLIKKVKRIMKPSSRISGAATPSALR